MFVTAAKITLATLPGLLLAEAGMVLGHSTLVPIGVAVGIASGSFFVGRHIQKFYGRLETLENKINGLYCVRHPECAQESKKGMVEYEQ